MNNSQEARLVMVKPILTIRQINLCLDMNFDAKAEYGNLKLF